jgi:hypothetical protein
MKPVPFHLGPGVELTNHHLAANYLPGNYARGLAEPYLIVGTWAIGYSSAQHTGFQCDCDPKLVRPR